MRNHLLLCVALIIALTLSACENTTVQDGNIDNPESAVSTEAEETNPVASKLVEVQELGTALFFFFFGFDNLSYTDKYSCVKEAEKQTALMNAVYQDIIDICESNSSYEDVEYQTKLLSHLIPMPISNDNNAIDNAEILYQMYFQQLSSSFSYFSEDLERMKENESSPIRTAFFDEVPKIPKPDTIIYGISFHSEKTEDGVVKYTYSSGDDAEDAQMNYNLYLIALGMDTGLTLQFDGAATYVYDGSDMVSAIMAGEDAQIGNFFMVSFPER